MPAPISVIIPVRNSAKDLPSCLAHLVSGLEAGLIREVIVSGVPSNDPCRDIAEETGAVWVEGDAGRGRQLKRGAEIARGDWFLFLHADTWLEDGWTNHVKTHITANTEEAGAFCLAFRSRTWRAGWVAALANLRSRFLGLPYGDQGLLISRDLYNTVGGYEPIPLMEDVSIARRLGRSRIALIPSRAFTSGEKQIRDGWITRSLKNIWLVIRYSFGADPERLAKIYYGR
ncbi:MAG: TIGR04283 family arsenosugar biosynthesis glycosyltransferase [Pseudomonadota bacterium]